MTPDEILADARMKILEHAGKNPDKWFYCNRYVFARLMLDERKTKVRVKKYLLDSEAPCHRCGKNFDEKSGIHLHRLNGARGYSKSNCVLMHAECHRQYHAEADESRGPYYTVGDSGKVDNGIVSKESKRYPSQYFSYWWDISPTLHAKLDEIAAIEFVKKDTRERCMIDTKLLVGLLTPENQTTRGQGNWGIRVLRDGGELFIESSGPRSEWVALPATWLSDEED